MRKLMFGFFTAAAMTGATPLLAQEDLFDKLDANKDGFVTGDEVPEERRGLLERLLRTSDKNEDKKLSKEEFAASLQNRDTPRTPIEGEGRRPGAPGGQFDAKQIFERLDANKDGKISKDEAIPDRMKEGFDRLDANSDGGIDATEFARVAGRGAPEGRPAGTPDGPGAAARKAAEEQFDRQDANSDGKLTKDEVPEERREMFQRMAERLDNKGEGGVTKEQFLRIVMAMQQGRPEGRPTDRPEGAPNRRPDAPPEGRPGADRRPDADRPAEGRPGADRPAGDRPTEGRPGQGRPGADRPGFGMGMLPVIRALDADGDGEVSADEIKSASAALTKLDKNGDGKLTREELMPEFPGPGGRPGEGPRPGDGPRPGARPNPEELMARLKEADANGDGKLSKEEAPAMMKENFDRIDANSDGFVDSTEIRQMLERFRGGPGGEGRPEGRRPEGGRPPGARPEGGRPEGRRPAEEKPAEPKND